MIAPPPLYLRPREQPCSVAMAVATEPRASKTKKTKRKAIVQAVLSILFGRGVHATKELITSFFKNQT